MALPCAVVVLVAATVLSLKVGGAAVSWRALADGLVRFSGTESDLVVRHVRLPRTLAGLAAGAALGVAGCVAQGLTRNPLAGPGTLGVNAGASFAIVAVMLAFGAEDLGAYVWAGFAGGAVAALAVYAIGATGRGGASPVKLAMAGAAVSALLLAMVNALVLLDHDLFARFRFWTIGSLTRADLATVGQAVPFLAAGLLVAVVLIRRLDALALGDDTARSLGARPTVVRVTGLVAVVVLAGTAVALAGPVAFVGLVAPHVARGLAGTAHRWVLPLSGLVAATVALLADVAGRVLIAPEEIQLGITAALVGGPFFLHLVRTRKVPAL
ncbi:iron ABC transporter permease [Pseudonocardia sp. C8]|nr:iron ABC transporter permease [Pseudonocardia sp. C8]MBC3193440.1 iron ABC transporter permease [Pseudonocardia sp. C8]